MSSADGDGDDPGPDTSTLAGHDGGNDDAGDDAGDDGRGPQPVLRFPVPPFGLRGRDDEPPRSYTLARSTAVALVGLLFVTSIALAWLLGLASSPARWVSDWYGLFPFP